MVLHIKKWHRIDTSFKTTGIFVGKTRVKNTDQGKKTPLGRIYEKCHVPLTPGLNHVNQVLTPQLKKELLLFLKKEVMVNTILNFHFVLNCILAKPESGNRVKRIRYSARSQTKKISRASNIKACILRSCVKLQQSLDTLSHTQSGRNYNYHTLYHSTH